MEKVVGKIVGLGVPGLILLVAINATGLAGAAAITTGLAALGPGGMIGGIVTLGITGFIADSIAEYGYEKIFHRVVQELYKRGETLPEIERKINKYPVSAKIKAKLKEELRTYWEKSVMEASDEKDKTTD
jgi:hypothetical protein